MLLPSASSFHSKQSGEQDNKHTQTSIHARAHSNSHITSTNSHHFLGQRKIYISSEELRCLCTRWVCLSLDSCGSPNQVRVCVCACKLTWALRNGRIWPCVCVCGLISEECQGVKGVGDKFVETHTGGWIKVIDQPWHAFTQRSKLNLNKWHLLVDVCVCFYASSQFISFKNSARIFTDMLFFSIKTGVVRYFRSKQWSYSNEKKQMH